MREMLDPIFGETGGTIALIAITLIVVLVLIAAVMWLIRRFGGAGVGAGSRGRMPRLAIVDALPVDARRRLVLVRRDNVEHLVLIGGTSDLVIEPSIIRTRVAQKPGQPAQPRPPGQAAAAASPAAPLSPHATPALPRRAEAAATEEPIPFPPVPRRAPAAARAPRPASRAEPARAVEKNPMPPEPETTFRPRILAEMEARAAADEAELSVTEAAIPSAHFSDVTRPTCINLFPEELPPSAGEPNEDVVDVFRRARPPRAADAGEDEASAADISPELDTAAAFAEDAPSGDEPAGGAARVSDLEKEMARLLGEISSCRQS